MTRTGPDPATDRRASSIEAGGPAMWSRRSCREGAGAGGGGSVGAGGGAAWCIAELVAAIVPSLRNSSQYVVPQPHSGRSPSAKLPPHHARNGLLHLPFMKRSPLYHSRSEGI